MRTRRGSLKTLTRTFNKKIMERFNTLVSVIVDMLPVEQYRRNNILFKIRAEEGGLTSVCLTLQQLEAITTQLSDFATVYRKRSRIFMVHAATRKKRLFKRLVHRVNKVTEERNYWRKRAAKLASGAIEVEADTPPVKKLKKSSLPPDIMRQNLLVWVVNNISEERVYQTVATVFEDRKVIDVTSPVKGCVIPFRWTGTMYVSAQHDEDGFPIYRLEI